jgi:two-component system OmpR family sensor kinase
MILRRLLTALALTLPFWLALLIDLALNALGSRTDILNLQARIDLGTFLLIVGALLSLIILVIWVTRLVKERWTLRLQVTVQREALQLRRRFLAQLDHELKNPLTALHVAIAYLADGPDLENYDDAIRDMSAQADRLGRLVTDLRKLAELEEQEIDRQPVDMEGLFEEVMEAAQGHPDYQQRQVRLYILHDPWRLPAVYGDRGLLWLACYNLVDNALKFTPAGASVEVRAFESRPWLIVEVIDNGPGIAVKDLPHIFEDLYRGDNARCLPGSGLGLALVRAIVNLHQGTVTVRSQPGQGTVFTMRLPSTASTGDTVH